MSAVRDVIAALLPDPPDYYKLACEVLGEKELETAPLVPAGLFRDSPRPNCGDLSDVSDQRLCAAVCKRTAGMTAALWKDLSEEQRIGWMLEAKKTMKAKRRDGRRGKTPRVEETGGEAKVLAALVMHHGYEPGGRASGLRSIGNHEPASLGSLVPLAGVSKATVSRILQKWFGGHRRYGVMCRQGTLKSKLASLQGETPERRCPGLWSEEDGRGEDD